MRQVRVFEGDDALGALDKLDDLLVAAAAPTTARPMWLRCYAGAYRDVVPVLVVVEEAGSAVAAAPLGRVDGWITEWTALGHAVSDYAVFPAADDGAARMLAAAVVAQVRGGRRPWRLRLDQFAAADPVQEQVCAALSNSHLRPGIPAPRLTLGADRELGTYLSKSVRRNRRKGLERLAEDGHDFRVVRTRDVAEVGSLLPATVAMRRRRDHARHGRSDFDDPRFGAFYHAALTELAAHGELELHAVTVGELVIGYLVLFLDGSAVRTWDGRVDSDWTRYAAGRVCDVGAIESALEDPAVTTFDWMRGEQEYKKSATDHVAEHRHLHAWSSPVLRHGFRVTAAVGRRSRRWAREVRRRIGSRSAG